MTAIPKTIGTVADKLFKLREQRLALQKQVDGLKSLETDLTKHGIGLLNKQRITSGRGKLATFSINTVIVAQATDWDAVYQHIVDNDAFDILQRRLNNKAVADRAEDGQHVAGTKLESIIKASLTKV
jgi:hypothetical protein